MKQKIGIIYSSTDGQTLKICKKINQHFIENKIPTKLFSIDEFSEDLSEFHTFIIGASIRYGKHNATISAFINNNKDKLNKITTAFFSVNLVARKEDKNLATTNPYLIKFINQIDWKPDFLDVFAGKLDYKAYKFFDRLMIKLIMKLTKGPTKTAKPIEFTDWERVDAFTFKILENYQKK